MNKIKYPPMILVTAIVLIFTFSCPAQDAAPTPADQSELSVWWDWCMDNSKVIWRVSKKYEVETGGGQHIRPYEERLKVPGQPKTPFGSMRRWRTYVEIRDSNDILRGLANHGWNYQTLEATGIGEGSWTKENWGGEE